MEGVIEWAVGWLAIAAVFVGTFVFYRASETVDRRFDAAQVEGEKEPLSIAVVRMVVGALPMLWFLAGLLLCIKFFIVG